MAATLTETEIATSGWTDRHTGISGIAFAVLAVAALWTSGNTPDYTATDAEWVSWFEDSGNTKLAVFSAFMVMFAVVALIGFVGGLAQRMRADSDRPDALQAVTVAGGIILAVAWLVGGALIAAAAGAIEFTDFPVPEADTLKMAEQLGFAVLLLGTGVGAFLLLGGTSLVARRSGMLPTWLAITGAVAAVILLIASAAFLPMVLLPLWVIAVSVVFLRGKPEVLRHA